MHLLPAEELTSVLTHLHEHGYAVARAATPLEAGLRATQAEIARALRLPDPAGTNLDAMVDTLRDLPQIWGADRVALVWEDAGRLAATTYLVPGTTILISWLVLGEIPTIWGLVGGAICLVGVGLTRRRSR